MNAQLLNSLNNPSLETVKERTYASAYEALSQGDLPNAERLFGMMVAMGPRDERPWVGLALARESRDDWRAAAGLYQIGGTFVPNSAWCHFGEGRAYAKLGMRNRADQALDKAESVAEDANLLTAIQEVRNEL